MHTHQAQGSLTRTGAHLKGTLLGVDDKNVNYELDITLKSELHPLVLRFHLK